MWQGFIPSICTVLFSQVVKGLFFLYLSAFLSTFIVDFHPYVIMWAISAAVPSFASYLKHAADHFFYSRNSFLIFKANLLQLCRSSILFRCHFYMVFSSKILCASNHSHDFFQVVPLLQNFFMDSLTISPCILPKKPKIYTHHHLFTSEECTTTIEEEFSPSKNALPPKFN